MVDARSGEKERLELFLRSRCGVHGEREAASAPKRLHASGEMDGAARGRVGPRAQFTEHLNMDGIKSLKTAEEPLYGKSEHPALEGGVECADSRAIDDDASKTLFQTSCRGLAVDAFPWEPVRFDLRRPIILFVSCKIRMTSKDLSRLAVEPSGKQGKDAKAEKVSLAKFFVIGGVLAERQPTTVDVAKNFVARGFEQRTDNSPGGLGGHSGESWRAGAPEEPQQHLLRLIAGGVAEGQTAPSEPLHGFPEELMAEGPCRHFERDLVLTSVSRDVSISGIEVEAEFSRQLFHEKPVFRGGFAAQAMVEMNDRERVADA